MAIDTANRRYAIIGFGRTYLRLVEPSGDLTANRFNFINIYNGIDLVFPIDLVTAPPALSISIESGAYGITVFSAFTVTIDETTVVVV